MQFPLYSEFRANHFDENSYRPARRETEYPRLFTVSVRDLKRQYKISGNQTIKQVKYVGCVSRLFPRILLGIITSVTPTRVSYATCIKYVHIKVGVRVCSRGRTNKTKPGVFHFVTLIQKRRYTNGTN